MLCEIYRFFWQGFCMYNMAASAMDIVNRIIGPKNEMQGL